MPLGTPKSSVELMVFIGFYAIGFLGNWFWGLTEKRVCIREMDHK
jgi:hypothetical protein